MAYGVIEYNEEGLVKCEVCGDYFHRPIAHARQKHDISAKEYKKQFGFDMTKGICSKESAEISRVHNKANYAKVVTKNLLKKGKSTRFKNGDAGRTRDKVSHQTLIALKERFKEFHKRTKE
jgi:hypothetical protein